MIGRKNSKHYLHINDNAFFALTRVKLDRLEKGENPNTFDLASELIIKGAETVKNEN